MYNVNNQIHVEYWAIESEWDGKRGRRDEEKQKDMTV